MILNISLRKNLLIILVGIAIILYLPVFLNHKDGYISFMPAAQSMLAGKFVTDGNSMFTYPPVFAFFMIPLIPLSIWAWNLIWYLILISSTIISIYLCKQFVVETFPLHLDERKINWILWISLALILKFIFSVFENQAYDGIVFLCILLGLEGERKGKPVLSCLGFALAAALKATPLLFLPYLLLRKRWWIFLGCVALYFGLSFLPDLFFTPNGQIAGHFGSWLHQIAGKAAKSTILGAQGMWFESVDANLNQSLRYLVLRVVALSGNLAYYNVILNTVFAMFIAFMGIILMRSARMRNPLALDASLIIIGMLMLSPMSSKSHFVALMLPYMVLTAYTVTDMRFRKPGIIILGASFALNTLTSKDLIGRKMGEVLLSCGCVVIGTMLLLVLIAYIVFKYNDLEKIET